MRAASFIFLLFLLIGLIGAAAGCTSSPAPAGDLLCRACTNDSQCGGNPCYADVSGQRYCGRPCDGGCPAGYSCAPLEGTGGQVVKTCFPDSLACASAPPPPGGGGGPDLGPAACPPPSGGGSVDVHGGSVDRLFFGYTGDTRSYDSVDAYPPSVQAVIDNIFTSLGKQGVQFMVDGGDHMQAGSAMQAQGNMDSYARAAQLLGKPVFMTMGNHECVTAYVSQDCGYAGAATSDYKMAAYMSTLQQLSGQSSPYYRFDVMTHSGKAVFLIVADDAWNADQQAWLSAQLDDADATARYTFVSKHHPDRNTSQPTFQGIYDLVVSHKHTLFLNGHTHAYKHTAGRPRSVVMGLGGAPIDNNADAWWGYLTITQCPDDRIQVTAYDQATGFVRDQFSVLPQ